MLELNKWFFVQLLNFLILLILLNIILFKPLLQLFKERGRRTKGFLDEAKAMDEEKENLLAQIKTKISEAKEKAKTIHEELKIEGSEIKNQTLNMAQKEAVEMSTKAKEELNATVKKAKENLKRDIETFSKKIVEKMVGV